MVEYLPSSEVTAATPRPQNHPMRQITRDVTFDAPTWTPERRRKVEKLFDELAPEWHLKHADDRLLPLRDALERGDIHPGNCLELGCGTGPATPILEESFTRVVAVDLSFEMLRRLNTPSAARVRADACCLPFPPDSVDSIVLLNMLLFPAEVARVLKPEGTVVWVNSRAENTPIHLSPEDFVAALPGDWTARASRSGEGLWAVARRGRSTS